SARRSSASARCPARPGTRSRGGSSSCRSRGTSRPWARSATRGRSSGAVSTCPTSRGRSRTRGGTSRDTPSSQGCDGRWRGIWKSCNNKKMSTTSTQVGSPRIVRISDFKDHVGETVRVAGWMHNKRSSGKLQFLIVRDGSGFAQAVMAKSAVPESSWQAGEEMGQESALELTGKVKEDKRAPGGCEVEVTGLVAVHKVHEYPITPKEHGTAFLMENRHLWLRSPRQHAVIRVRHAVVKAVRDHLDDSGFTLVDTPIFTPAACEGTTTLFAVPYFDEGTAYLTQSGQLYNEATAAAHGKVYCFGPTFRAEKSKTRRHLTEFWMVEPEVAWNDSDANMGLQEEFVSYIVARCLERRRAELAELERDVTALEAVRPPFPRITYTDAVAKLQALGGDMEWGRDLGGDEETLLAKQYDRPVMVFNYPKAVKAFYMKEN